MSVKHSQLRKFLLDQTVPFPSEFELIENFQIHSEEKYYVIEALIPGLWEVEKLVVIFFWLHQNIDSQHCVTVRGLHRNHFYRFEGEFTSWISPKYYLVHLKIAKFTLLKFEEVALQQPGKNYGSVIGDFYGLRIELNIPIKLRFNHNTEPKLVHNFGLIVKDIPKEFKVINVLCRNYQEIVTGRNTFTFIDGIAQIFFLYKGEIISISFDQNRLFL